MKTAMVDGFPSLYIIIIIIIIIIINFQNEKACTASLFTQQTTSFYGL